MYFTLSRHLGTMPNFINFYKNLISLDLNYKLSLRLNFKKSFTEKIQDEKKKIRGGIKIFSGVGLKNL